MTESNDRSKTFASDHEPRTSRARRLGLFALGLAGLLVLSASAWHRHAHAHGQGSGVLGWSDHARDPETSARRIDAMTSWLLSDVDATAEQRARIAQVVKDAVGELRPLRDRHQAARRETLQLIAASTIDRARLEKLRSEQVQLVETVSRRLLQATLDAAEALTPEQRARLTERWQQRAQRHHG